ncbi:MAG: alpha/beta fold hydrolase [Sandaracinaceae bacterium]
MQYDDEGFVSAKDGTRLFWGERGEGPAIVLNDGIGCDGFAWKYLQPHLAADHRVVHWHYRAHGRSGLPVDVGRIDVPAHARDLLSVLDARQIDRAVLVGHSMGTQVALETYRLAPERVRGFILVCGSYGKVTATFHGSDVLKQVLPTIIDAVEKNQGLARALWGRIPAKLAFQLARFSKEVDALNIREDDFRPYMEHVSAMEPRLFLAMLRFAGEHTAEDILDRIDVPTLVIAAERDTFTPCPLAEHMAEAIPGAEIFVLRGASHAAPIEQPDAIQARIDDFLDRTEAHEPLALPQKDAS